MQIFPLHGPGDVEGAGFLQRFIDSPLGYFTASASHTAGALLFTAGIALYLYVAHLIRRANTTGAKPDLSLISYAHWFTLSGIVLNGLGGVARLRQSGHPGLDQVATSGWVQVLLVKHLFLVAGVSLAVYLTWRTRGFRRRARIDLPAIRRESPRMVAFALGSMAAILIATLLGVVASMADIDGMSDGDDMMGMDGNSPIGVIAGPTTVTGFISGAQQVPGGLLPGGANGVQEHRFTVPEGADVFQADLAWTTDAFTLSLALIDPEGNTVGTTSPGEARTSVKAEGDEVVPGLWTVRVSAVSAINEGYELTMQAMRTGGLNSIIETVTIAAGDHHELDLNIPVGSTVTFEWSLSESSEIYFNIHYHDLEKGQTETPIEGTWNRFEGDFTKETESTGPSFFWDNTAGSPVTLRYQILGSFDSPHGHDA